MPIYEPQIRLSSDDKELLHLLAELITSSNAKDHHRNYPPNHAVLSDIEYSRLLTLLETFVSSKRFVEGSYLIEQVLGRKAEYPNDLRNIYLRWKTRHGRSRAMATDQWGSFLERLGRSTSSGSPWYRDPVTKMTFDHFMKMEDKLSKGANLAPRVRSLLLSFVRSQETYIESVRSGSAHLHDGQISLLPKSLLKSIGNHRAARADLEPLSTNKIIGIAVIVMDFSTLFTTRDWDVSGFMSTIAGAAPAVMLTSD